MKEKAFSKRSSAKTLKCLNNWKSSLQLNQFAIVRVAQSNQHSIHGIFSKVGTIWLVRTSSIQRSSVRWLKGYIMRRQKARQSLKINFLKLWSLNLLLEINLRFAKILKMKFLNNSPITRLKLRRLKNNLRINQERTLQPKKLKRLQWLIWKNSKNQTNKNYFLFLIVKVLWQVHSLILTRLTVHLLTNKNWEMI